MPTNRNERRDFLKRCLVTGAAGAAVAAETSAEPRSFEISLAQWSLHKALFGRKGKKIDNLDFAEVAKRQCGVGAIEYVNQFFKDKADDSRYLAELDKRARDQGVKQLLIMVDGEGDLGDPDPRKRTRAIENHHKWVTASKTLGGHSIRVNARSAGSDDEQRKLAADGLARLTEFAAKLRINVLVENHGGLSSNGKWLAGVLEDVGSPYCGSLPDFGNFRVTKDVEYDRYRGVKELMPFAKAVSAKSHDFDDKGNETHTDYRRMMKIVLDADYRGYVGIEYEGSSLPEIDGILATRRLLERVRAELAS